MMDSLCAYLNTRSLVYYLTAQSQVPSCQGKPNLTSLRRRMCSRIDRSLVKFVNATLIAGA